jgi:hypothetical protein
MGRVLREGELEKSLEKCGVGLRITPPLKTKKASTPSPLLGSSTEQILDDMLGGLDYMG